jgi:hypothetical protein
MPQGAREGPNDKRGMGGRGEASAALACTGGKRS